MRTPVTRELIASSFDSAQLNEDSLIRAAFSAVPWGKVGRVNGRRVEAAVDRAYAACRQAIINELTAALSPAP